MRHAALRIFLFAGLAAMSTAQSQPLNCTAFPGGSPLLRYPGITEELGQFSVVCTGGTPTPLNEPVPMHDITISLNTNVTSRLYSANGSSSGWSEALLLIDDPPAGSRLPCPRTMAYCQLFGTGTGSGTYSGVYPRVNVFQGKVTGSGTLTWTNVPIDPPGPSRGRTLRFVNLRANAFLLGLPSGGIPPAALATVTISGLEVASSSMLTLGYAQPAIAWQSSSSVVQLSRSQSWNPGLLIGNSEGALSPVSIVVREMFPNAFKPRTVAPYLGPDVSPDPVNQNNLSQIYHAETAFYDRDIPDPDGDGAIRTAGLAAFGTRLRIEFSDIPKELALYLPTTVNLAVRTGLVTGIARRIVSDEGPFQPVGVAGALAPLTPGRKPNSGFAVYEVLQSNPGVIDEINFAVYPAYRAKIDGGKDIRKSTVSFRVLLAPASEVLTADASFQIPRYVDASPRDWIELIDFVK